MPLRTRLLAATAAALCALGAGAPPAGAAGTDLRSAAVHATDLPGSGWQGGVGHLAGARGELQGCLGTDGTEAHLRRSTSAVWTRADRSGVVQVQSSSALLTPAASRSLPRAYRGRLTACARTELLPRLTSVAPTDTSRALVQALRVRAPRGVHVTGARLVLPLAGGSRASLGYDLVHVTSGRVTSDIVVLSTGSGLSRSALELLTRRVADRMADLQD